MKKNTAIWKKWRLWLAVILFISINQIVTNANHQEKESPSNEIRISDSNISTH